MKNNKFSFAALLAVFIFSAVVYSSCTKENKTNDADKFVGTWNGTTQCKGSGTATGGTFTFSKGDANTVTMPYTAGNGSCQQAKTLSLAASGNVATFSTTFTDGCNNSYNLNGSATLNGSTLTYVINFSGAAGTGTCTFTGTK